MHIHFDVVIFIYLLVVQFYTSDNYHCFYQFFSSSYHPTVTISFSSIFWIDQQKNSVWKEINGQIVQATFIILTYFQMFLSIKTKTTRLRRMPYQEFIVFSEFYCSRFGKFNAQILSFVYGWRTVLKWIIIKLNISQKIQSNQISFP